MSETSPRARKSETRVSMMAEQFARMGSMDDKPTPEGKQAKRRMSAKILEAKEFYEGTRGSKAREARKKSVINDKELEEDKDKAPPKSAEGEGVEQKSEEVVTEATPKAAENAPDEAQAESPEAAEEGEVEAEEKLKKEPEETPKPENTEDGPEKTAEEPAEAAPAKGADSAETKADELKQETAHEANDRTANAGAEPEAKVETAETPEVPEKEEAQKTVEPIEETDAPVLEQQVTVVPTEGHNVGVVEKKTILVETTPFGLTSSNLLVLRVWGAAKEAGVSVGDRITKVNKVEVTKNREMKELFADSAVPFEMEFIVGDESSAEKAKSVLARLEEQELEQKKDTFVSRRQSEAASDRKARGVLSEKVYKKSGLLGSGTRYLKMHGKCIFYAHDEKTIDTAEKLEVLEKEHREGKSKKKKIVVIPVENIVGVVETAEGGMKLTVKLAKGSREYIFASTGKSFFKKWSEAIKGAQSE
mmetsp:Transcript_38698/g.75135  ORF Transcript_38698/g.75135 Transcript_38698/m.75135 type:complete len:476 (-) Transcript_38698:177-1604(-)